MEINPHDKLTLKHIWYSWF